MSVAVKKFPLFLISISKFIENFEYHLEANTNMLEISNEIHVQDRNLYREYYGRERKHLACLPKPTLIWMLLVLRAFVNDVTVPNSFLDLSTTA